MARKSSPGRALRNRRRRLAHAEANFQDLRARPAENTSEVQRGGSEGNSEARKQRLVRALLRRRESPLTQHEASNRAMATSRCRTVNRHHLGATRFHTGSMSLRSTMAALSAPAGVYSIASVFESFHVATTSDQGSAGVHTSSFTSDSGRYAPHRDFVDAAARTYVGGDEAKAVRRELRLRRKIEAKVGRSPQDDEAGRLSRRRIKNHRVDRVEIIPKTVRAAVDRIVAVGECRGARTGRAKPGARYRRGGQDWVSASVALLRSGARSGRGPRRCRTG